MSDSRQKWLLFGTILVFTFASFIGINSYSYGMWNQFISLPWLYDLLDDSLYPHDVLIDQRENSPSIYNYFLKWLLPIFFENIALLHLVLFLAVNLLTFFSFFKLAQALFLEARAAFFAFVVMSFSFPLLAQVPLWDTSLMERSLTYPLLIFSLYFILKKRWLMAVLLQGAAFNFHPLSASYLIGCSWLAVLFAEGFRFKFIRWWPVLILLLSPVFYMKYLQSGASGESAFAVTHEWMEVMRLRNTEHSFPTGFNKWLVVKAFLIIVTYFILALKNPFERYIKRWLLGFGIGVVVLLLIGTIFTEMIPVRIIIQLQFYRAFPLLVALTLVLWAGLIIKHSRPLYFLLGAPILLQFYYGVWPKAIAATVLIVFAYWCLKPSRKGLSWKATLPITALYLFIGIAGYWMRGDLKITNGLQEEEWYQVQYWARDNSAKDAIVIVPPPNPGFRVHSFRSSYGDWYDGTKAFFSEDYGSLWWNHMEALGTTHPDSLREQYQKNSDKDFLRIWESDLAAKHSEGYVVVYSEMNLPSLSLTYENEKFKVYKLHDFDDERSYLSEASNKTRNRSQDSPTPK